MFFFPRSWTFNKHFFVMPSVFNSSLFWILEFYFATVRTATPPPCRFFFSMTGTSSDMRTVQTQVQSPQSKSLWDKLIQWCNFMCLSRKIGWYCMHFISVLLSKKWFILYLSPVKLDKLISIIVLVYMILLNLKIQSPHCFCSWMEIWPVRKYNVELANCMWLHMCLTSNLPTWTPWSNFLLKILKYMSTIKQLK